MSRLRTALSIATVGIALGAQPVAAQNSDVPIGTRVRVTARGYERSTGVVSQSTPDSLILLGTRTGRSAIATSAVTRIEISEGRSTGAGAANGLKWGAIAGVPAAGLIWLLAQDADAKEALQAGDKSVSTGELAAMEFAGCLAIGAAIGALVKVERWHMIERSSAIVSLSPGRALRVGIRRSFALGSPF